MSHTLAPPVLSLIALGVRIDVDLSALPPAERDRFRAAWSRSVIEAGEAGRADGPAVQLEAPEPDPTAGFGYDEIADLLSSQITIAAITHHAGQLIMLHAAGLAEPGSGRTVAFVGPSGRGKTTLTSVLGREWDYVTDEAVGVEPQTLQVFAHPKPLSVKTGDDGPKEQVNADDLALRPTPQQCRLGKVVLLERDGDHHGPAEITPVDVAAAVGALTSESSFLDRWPDPLGVTAALLAATGGAVRLRYGNTTDLTGVLPALLAAPGSVEWSFEDADPAGADGQELGPDTWQRIPAPALYGTTHVALLVTQDGQPHVTVLEGIGPLLWELTAVPATTADLTSAVVELAGPPPGADAATLVESALRSLRDHGVLRGPADPPDADDAAVADAG